MENCLMERKWDDWRIFAFDTIFGDTVMVRRQVFWIRSNLSHLDFEIRDLQASSNRRLLFYFGHILDAHRPNNIGRRTTEYLSLFH